MAKQCLKAIAKNVKKCFANSIVSRLYPLLGLSYLWVSGSNGISIQVYATWIFYAVLNDLCSSVAVELGQPKERISVEMVFRGLYHFSRALLRGESTDAVTYLVKHQKMLGLIKQQRKRHRDKAAFDQEIWKSTA